MAVNPHSRCLHAMGCCQSIYTKQTQYLGFTWCHMQMATYLQMVHSARADKARSQPTVVINSGSVVLYASQGLDMPSVRVHVWSDTPRQLHSLQPTAIQQQHDGAADQHKRCKDLRQAHCAVSALAVILQRTE